MTNVLIETERQQLKCCENCDNFIGYDKCMNIYGVLSDVFNEWSTKTDSCTRHEFKKDEK